MLNWLKSNKMVVIVAGLVVIAVMAGIIASLAFSGRLFNDNQIGNATTVVDNSKSDNIESSGGTASENISEEITENTSDNVTENTSENITENTTETTEATSENITEPTTEKTTENNTEEPTTKTPTVDEILASMTIEEKICQMFILAPENLMGGWNVTTADADMKAKIIEYPVGGFIMFGANIVTPSQTKTMINNLQIYSNEITGLPFFICIDEEGGRVARIGNNESFAVTKVGAMNSIATREAAYNAGYTIGNYLSKYGFNFNFAPDADVLTNPENTVINDRSFGSDAKKVAEYAVAYSDGLHANNVMSTFKHFPGHGSTEGDTHEGFAYTSKTYEELLEEELLPFKEAATNKVDAVMVAHISVPTILGDNTPCTLSKYMVTDVLRNDLGYKGLIVTDALDMGAITNEYTDGEAAVKAILAGNDILLKPKDFYAAYEGVLEAVNNGTISKSRIDESVRRIINAKLSL